MVSGVYFGRVAVSFPVASDLMVVDLDDSGTDRSSDRTDELLPRYSCCCCCCLIVDGVSTGRGGGGVGYGSGPCGETNDLAATEPSLVTLLKPVAGAVVEADVDEATGVVILE